MSEQQTPRPIDWSDEHDRQFGKLSARIRQWSWSRRRIGKISTARKVTLQEGGEV